MDKRVHSDSVSAGQRAPLIDGLKPYPEMRDTGLSWLPRAPAHWELWRNGRLFGPRRETGFPDLPILEVSLRSGVRVRDMESGRKQQMADRSRYLRAREGDIAYNMMRMWQGAVGVVPTDGLVSPAYVVARPFAEAYAPYYAYLFRTAAYMGEVDNYSRGIVKDRNRLYWESFKQIFSAVPPLEEQRAIVRFLDCHGSLTAKLIRAKRRLIALLNEQKQAIVHRAVTRGLDPNARLAPSGVPWLGDIPADWDVVALKRIARFKSGAGFPVVHQGGRELPVPFLKVSDMNLVGNERVIRRWNNSISGETATALGAYVFPKRTIVFPKVGGAMLTNKRRILHVESCIDNNLMGCIVEGANLDFVFAVLEQLDFGRLCKPGPVPAIGEGEIREIRLALPPLDFQQRIVEHLKVSTSTLEESIRAAVVQTVLIGELHSRLIAGVISGQWDVRTIAADLPETQEEMLVVQPSDTDEDLDDETERDVEEAA